MKKMIVATVAHWPIIKWSQFVSVMFCIGLLRVCLWQSFRLSSLSNLTNQYRQTHKPRCKHLLTHTHTFSFSIWLPLQALLAHCSLLMLLLLLLLLLSLLPSSPRSPICLSAYLAEPANNLVSIFSMKPKVSSSLLMFCSCPLLAATDLAGAAND